MITWLSSYPRSGNTFLRIILKRKFGIRSYSIYDDVADIGADDKTSDIVGHSFLPDGFELSAARAESQQYFIKTHELPDERISDKDRVIYLMRDGRESAYSLVKHQRKFGANHTILADVINGNVFGGLWGKHVTAWSPGTRNNCLLIKYEDLVSSADEQVSRLSGFIGMDAKKTRIPTFKSLQKINPDFFSSGKIDTWRQVYTEEDNFLFWLKNYRVMEEYGYLDSMPDCFKSGRNLGLFRAISDENAYFLNTFIKHSGILNSRISELAHAKGREEQSSLHLLNREVSKNNALKEELGHIRLEISGAVETYTKQNDLLGRSVDELRTERNRIARESLAEKENLNSIIERKTAEIEAANGRYETELDDIRKRLDVSDAGQETLKEKLAEQKRINTRLNENMAALAASNHQQSKESADCAAERDELLKLNANQGEQLERLRTERNRIARESLAEKENLNSIIERKTAEIEAANGRYETELDDIRKRLDVSDAGQETLKEKLAEQKRINTRLNENMAALAASNHQQSKESADCAAERDELLKLNANLGEQLERWQENSRVTLEKCALLQAELDRSKALVDEIFGTKRWRYSSKLIDFVKK